MSSRRCSESCGIPSPVHSLPFTPMPYPATHLPFARRPVGLSGGGIARFAYRFRRHEYRSELAAPGRHELTPNISVASLQRDLSVQPVGAYMSPVTPGQSQVGELLYTLRVPRGRQAITSVHCAGGHECAGGYGHTRDARCSDLKTPGHFRRIGNKATGSRVRDRASVGVFVSRRTSTG